MIVTLTSVRERLCFALAVWFSLTEQRSAWLSPRWQVDTTEDLVTLIRALCTQYEWKVNYLAFEPDRKSAEEQLAWLRQARIDVFVAAAQCPDVLDGLAKVLRS